MRLQEISHLTLRKPPAFIAGHLFEHLSAGIAYEVLSCKSYLLAIKDDRGQTIHVTGTALKRYFNPT